VLDRNPRHPPPKPTMDRRGPSSRTFRGATDDPRPTRQAPQRAECAKLAMRRLIRRGSRWKSFGRHRRLAGLTYRSVGKGDRRS